jgi:hypothetical protein
MCEHSAWGFDGLTSGWPTEMIARNAAMKGPIPVEHGRIAPDGFQRLFERAHIGPVTLKVLNSKWVRRRLRQRFEAGTLGGLNSQFRVICLSSGGVLRCILL